MLWLRVVYYTYMILQVRVVFDFSFMGLSTAEEYWFNLAARVTWHLETASFSRKITRNHWGIRMVSDRKKNGEPTNGWGINKSF